MKTILFVCTGNLCRSPMAAALMRERLTQTGLDAEVRVLSAGVWAAAGAKASANAATVLAGRGLDLSEHRSQPVTPALLAEADVILVMEEAHRRSLFYLAPQHLAKVFLLAEMAGEYDDISDPYGGTREEYMGTADLLAGLIDKGLPAILKRLGLTSEAAPGTSGA